MRKGDQRGGNGIGVGSPLARWLTAWRLGASGDLQLRQNGLVAEVNTASAAFNVRMAFFTVKPNQKWFVLPA